MLMRPPKTDEADFAKVNEALKSVSCACLTETWMRGEPAPDLG